MWTRLLLCGLAIAALAPPSYSQPRVSDLQLIGSVKVSPPGPGLLAAAGVSAYKELAFVGMPPYVVITDISDPTHPVIVGQTPAPVALPPSPNLFFEEHRALRLGQRDVLIVLFARSGSAAPGYLKIFDISNPAQPLEIGSYETTYSGIHFEIVKQGARTLALLSLLRAEAVSSNYGQNPGTGDLVILDISDPTNPVMVGEWGVIDEPALGLNFYLTEQRGTLSRGYGEGVWASPNGRTAYYAYSDFGVMILDISDPTAPKFVGRVGYEADEDGDAHQVRITKGGNVLIRSSIVRWPFQTRVSSNVFSGVRSAGEDANTPAIYSLTGHRLDGAVFPVGLGCFEADYPVGLNGKIALIQEGSCGVGGAWPALKVVWAQEAGAAGAIFYNPNRPGGYDDAHGRPGTLGRLNPGPGLDPVPITIPVVAAGWNTGSCLAQTKDGDGHLVAAGCSENAEVVISAESFFAGYGRIDVFDISNPAAPLKLSSIGTEHTMDIEYELANRYPAPTPSRDVTANHMEVAGNTLYASFWADGLRIFDIAQPSAPREIGSWTGQGAAPGDVDLRAWKVIRHNGLILLNSLYHGLYILE